MGEDLGELIVTISADMSKLQAGLAAAGQAVKEFSGSNMDAVTRAQVSFGNSIQKTGQSMVAFGTQLRSVGRELTQLSGIFTLAGGVGMAPFILALHDSANSIMPVGQALRQLSDVGQVFYETIAQAVLPVIRNFTTQLNGLLQWFLKLPQPMRDSIAQAVLLNSALLVGTGIILKISAEVVNFIRDVALLAGKFLEFAGIMVATNPVMLAVGVAIAALIALMIKFKNVADLVMNAFELLFRWLKGSFSEISAVIETALSKVYGALAQVYEWMAKLPGPTQAFFKTTADGAKNLSNTLQDLANNGFKDVSNQSQKMGQILTTGTGEWAKDFDNLKTTVQGFFTAFQQGSTQFVDSHKTMQSGIQGTVGALQTLGSALQGASSINREFAVAAGVVAIGMAIMNTATGITKALADYPWPYSMAVAAIVGAAGAIQIATIASQQFAEGTDTVPAMLSPGEMVIPSTFAGAIRSGKLSLSGGNSSNTTNNGGNYNISISVQAAINSQTDIDTLGKSLGRSIEQQLRRVKN